MKGVDILMSLVRVPEFRLQNDKGEWITHSQLKGKYGVLFFFPKAFTPGCTKECIAFSDQQPTFTLELEDRNSEEEFDSVVPIGEGIEDPRVLWIGVSRDSPSTLAKFRSKHGLTIELMSDDGTLSQALGSAGIGGTVKRTSFVFDPWGVIRAKWDKVKVSGHDDEVSSFLKRIMQQDRSTLPAIENRRAYRGIRRDPISRDLLDQIMLSAHLAPSCSNNQPWHFEVISDPQILERVYPHLTAGNGWMRNAPVLVGVHGDPAADCQLSDERGYLLFDLGLASAFLMIQATQIGLVAHPVAGYEPSPIKDLLGIPSSHILITLIALGYPSDGSELSEKNQKREIAERSRKPIEGVVTFR